MPDTAASPPPIEPPLPREGRLRRAARRWLAIRGPIPQWQAVLFGIACVAVCLGAWWLVTRGAGEERILSPVLLPSPEETFASFRSLWFDRALMRNLLITLQRVTLGFLLAVAVGVPFGVLAGCFTRLQAFLAPVIMFGRNIPIAALIPITFFAFGIGETQKVMFIFFASVAFVTADAARAVMNVGQEFIDTAYTLGANRRQVILQVLVPSALPHVFNSLRLLFGLAFGYIMLAELVKFGSEAGGLGHLINTSQHRGPREHIYLVVLIIPLVALVIDRFLFWIQRELFPHRYGGAGVLNMGVRGALHLWDDFKGLIWSAPVPVDTVAPAPVGDAATPPDDPVPPRPDEAAPTETDRDPT
ncbi:MAG: ABC transporter permease [Planctomycetales bacterium]